MSNPTPPAPNLVLRVLYRLDETAYVALQAARPFLAGQSRLRLTLAGLVLLALPVGGILLLLRDAPDEPMTRRQLTSQGSSAVVRGAAISPDGRALAFSDNEGLHLLTLETLSARKLHGTKEMIATELTWSPDGSRLYFVGSRTDRSTPALWVVDTERIRPRRFRDSATSPELSPDGASLAFAQQSGERSSIWVVDADGEQARVVAEDARHDFTHPTWLSEGRLAFVRARPDDSAAEIVTRGVDGGETVVAVRNFDPRTPPCWSPDGRLVFGRTDRHGASLWSLRIDPGSGKPDPEPTKIVEQTGVAYFSELSIDRASKRLGFIPVRTQVAPHVADLGGRDSTLSPRRVGNGLGDAWPVAWNAEGESLLVRSKHDGRSQIVLQPLDGQASQSVAPGLLLAREPDGSILYEAGDGAGLMRASPSKDEPELAGHASLPVDSGRPVLRCPRREGRDCVLAAQVQEILHLYSFDPRKADGRGRELARVGLNGRDYGWNLSPDGGRVAVVNGGRTIKLVNLHNGMIRKLAIQPSVYSQGIAWAASGRALYLSGMLLHSGGGHVLFSVDLSGRTRLLWQTKDRWFGEPLPSPDGKQLALAARTVEADAWMLENF